MSSGIYTFLNTELTCLPNAIRKIAGKYYSNAHCNGATWLFFFWTILHLVFDKYLHALLLKLKFKPYIRSRLKDSLWYLGFFSTALVYSWATLIRDEVELFNFKKMHVPSETNLSQQIVGHTLISTFYLHSSLWEGLKNRSLLKFVKYFCLAALCTCSYILRVAEIVYTLTGIISLSEVAVHLTRIFYSFGETDSRCLNLFFFMLFAVSFCLFSVLYVVVIPLTFVVPLGLKMLSDYPNILLIFMYLNLLGWLTMELYQSVLFNLIDHHLYHKRKLYNKCPDKALECALFLPRDDETYNLQILRTQAKERQQEMISKRKPKLLPTLKCMVAIKRKISERRRADQSDSDSEKSDKEVLIKEVTENSKSENTNDDIKFMDEDNEHSVEDNAQKCLLGGCDDTTHESSNSESANTIEQNKIEDRLGNLSEESPIQSETELTDEISDRGIIYDDDQVLKFSEKAKNSMSGDNNATKFETEINHEENEESLDVKNINSKFSMDGRDENDKGSVDSK